jgi:hypothetical protein
VSFIELAADLLDGWANARALLSEPFDDAVARSLDAALHDMQLPTTWPESEELLRSLPPLSDGGATPVVHGSWADWGSHDEWGPTIGLVDVNHSDPTRTTGTDLVSSLMAANDEGFVARGSIDSAEHSVSWIVGIATEPVERHYGLVLGSRGPMAFVILASDERELLDVIGAIRAAIPRAG